MSSIEELTAFIDKRIKEQPSSSKAIEILKELQNLLRIKPKKVLGETENPLETLSNLVDGLINSSEAIVALSNKQQNLNDLFDLDRPFLTYLLSHPWHFHSLMDAPDEISLFSDEALSVMKNTDLSGMDLLANEDKAQEIIYYHEEVIKLLEVMNKEDLLALDLPLVCTNIENAQKLAELRISWKEFSKLAPEVQKVLLRDSAKLAELVHQGHTTLGQIEHILTVKLPGFKILDKTVVESKGEVCSEFGVAVTGTENQQYQQWSAQFFNRYNHFLNDPESVEAQEFLSEDPLEGLDPGLAKKLGS